MAKQTEYIDRLFLELSQFTSAVTEREINLARAMHNLMAKVPEDERKSPEWDAAVILIDCMNRGVN